MIDRLLPVPDLIVGTDEVGNSESRYLTRHKVQKNDVALEDVHGRDVTHVVRACKGVVFSDDLPVAERKKVGSYLYKLVDTHTCLEYDKGVDPRSRARQHRDQLMQKYRRADRAAEPWRVAEDELIEEIEVPADRLRQQHRGQIARAIRRHTGSDAHKHVSTERLDRFF